MTSQEPESTDQNPEASQDEAFESDGELRPQSILPPRREPLVQDENLAGEDSGPTEEGSSKSDRRPSRMVPSKEAVLGEAADPFVSIEDKEWSKNVTHSKTWVITIAIVVLVLIVGAIVMLRQMESATVVDDDGEQRDKKFAAARSAVVEDLKQRKDEARNMFGDFATAQVVEEILPMVRNSGELKGVIRELGHMRLVEGKWKPSEKSQWVLLSYAERPYACLMGEFPDLTKYCAYFVVEDDKLFLDWPATIAYGTASFEDLSKGVGDGSVIRGTLRPANFHAQGFSEVEYQSYQLESPDGRDMIWCYARRGSKVAKILAAVYGRGEVTEGRDHKLRFTIHLKRKQEDSLSNQWLIEELHHEGWIKF